jgi:MFS family permease
MAGVTAGRYGDAAPFYLGAAFSLIALPIVANVTTVSRLSSRASVCEVQELLRIPPVLQLCVANLLCFSLAGVWAAFLPLYILRQGISIPIVGWVFTTQGLSYALTQFSIGRLIGKLREGRLALMGIAGMAGMVLLVPLFHAPAVFLMASALYGLAYGLIPVTFASLVAQVAPREKYATGMGLFNSAIDFGLFVGPLVGGGAASISILAPFFLALPLGMGAIVMGLWALRRIS